MNNANILKPSITTKLSKSKAIFLLFFALFSLALFLPTPAKAASFEAGRIIDDSIFVNKNSMSVADIQNFLNSKVPTCNRWHAGFTGTSGTVYSPPWTCLKEYNENPTTKQNNIGQFNPDGSPVVVPGGLSAAQIIWNAAQTYSINPQVILVTLQKENGLITDDWAASWQYRTAMGFGCPDGAPCDAQWFGFANQVTQGTRHFRNFFDGVRSGGFWTPRLPGVNTISYNPNSACGASSVNITTRAAAALYSYTPYQPNAAALNNLYGTGDACSAYGNRNFWRDFTGWFGSTTGIDYDYSFVGASAGAYITTEPGQPRNGHFITIRNTGTNTWYSDGNTPAGVSPVRLMLKNYQDTPFADTSDPNWLGTRDQIKMATAVVAPGETATFIFNLKGPYSYVLNYANNFVPVVDGVKVMKDIGMRFVTSSKIPAYSFVSAINPPASIMGNEQATASVTIKNTSSTVWYKDGSVPAGKKPTRLSSKNNVATSFADKTSPSWLGTNSKIAMDQAIVNPGENATFTINLAGPLGNYSESFRFVPEIQDFAQFSDIGMLFNLKTPPYSNSYSFVSAINPPAIMAKSSITNTNIVLKNTGSTVWRNEATRLNFGSLRLAMQGYAPSPFYSSTDSNWLTSSQIKMTTPMVLPGQNGTFSFSWKAPSVAGVYSSRFQPVLDGYQWLQDVGMQFVVNVQ